MRRQFLFTLFTLINYDVLIMDVENLRIYIESDMYEVDHVIRPNAESLDFVGISHLTVDWSFLVSMLSVCFCSMC